jgi:hypothetical protein
MQQLLIWVSIQFSTSIDLQPKSCIYWILEVYLFWIGLIRLSLSAEFVSHSPVLSVMAYEQELFIKFSRIIHEPLNHSLFSMQGDTWYVLFQKFSTGASKWEHVRLSSTTSTRAQKAKFANFEQSSPVALGGETREMAANDWMASSCGASRRATGLLSNLQRLLNYSVHQLPSAVAESQKLT